jgi:dynein heavy chain
MQAAERSQTDTDSKRAICIPVANCAQCLFFHVLDLSNVDPICQYSFMEFEGSFLYSQEPT